MPHETEKVTQLPLEGVTVVDLTKSIAGPYCTMLLAEMGATVVKIERPEGDDARTWGPPFWGGNGVGFLAVNRNKKSLAIDVKSPAGQKVLWDLIGSSDVVVENLRAGAADRLGFGFANVHAKFPSVIYCSMSAYGSMGPMKDHPGYDVLAQAFGGLMSVTGEPGGAPVRVGTSVMDAGMGLWGAMGVMAALMQRAKTGVGQLVQTSLFETAVGWMLLPMTGYFGTGNVPKPLGSALAGLAPYEAYPTKDGHIVVGVGNQKLWTAFCTALGVPELLEDARFTTNADRVVHRTELFDVLAAVFTTSTTSEWVERLDAVTVPCSPIQTIDQVVAHPQTEAMGILRSVPHPHIADYREIGIPLRWDGVRPGTRTVPPEVGSDTREILLGLGYSEADIDGLIANGIAAEQPNP